MEMLTFLPVTILINKYILRMLLHSVVCIVTGYGLDDREFGVRVLVGSRILTLPCKTGSGVHPASYPMDTRCFFSGDKGAGV
jgi:hypothetical protein